MERTTFPELQIAGDGIAPEEFHRLSVAFGLTFDAELIGRIVPAEEIEDLVIASLRHERPDRDDLYPK